MMVHKQLGNRRTLAVLGALFGLASTSARACIHVPREYKDVVSERTKEALLFHDGKNAHLIIKTHLSTRKSLPSSLAWVIPVPSLPSRYEETDPALFQELFRATEPSPPPAMGLRGSKGRTQAMAGAAAPLKVHSAVTVGRYEIRPIEILDPKAGNDLNRWLGRNGYGKVTLSLQKQYLRKKAVFLAVKVSGLKDSSAVLKPLHIVYYADRVSMPLKFAENSGVFDVVLYTLTRDRLHGGQFGASYLYGHGTAVELKSGAKTPTLARLTGGKLGFLTRFTGTGLNSPGRLVKSIPVDPAIHGESRKVSLMGPPSPVVPVESRIRNGMRIGQRVAVR